MMNPFSIADDRNRANHGKWGLEFIGFWLLGLCNNFGYVVMLSAAHDILKQEKNDNLTQPVSHNATNQFDCNPISTGAILLADVLPELIIKLIAPFFMHKISYNIRFVFVVLFAVSALIIVGTSKVIALSLFGVVCASISAGIGEITMLQLTSFYAKHTVSAWSSGTGAAGLFGALSYTGLTSLLKLSPRTAILILLFIPVLLVISYIMVGASQAVARHRQYQLISEQTTTDVDTGRENNRFIRKCLTNMGIFFACIYRTAYIPSIWLVFGLVVFEGLIGGGAYVNTFYKISIEIPKPDREFSMGVASIGDSFGITFAGLSAIPLHNAICR
ncbi:unnamed protein product [Rotaria sp. Silwood2]|nr:unnamed protein product [Rotaria sp. Silwood2]CAF2972799.1 unnamed protein product [Rotaria sp. Silwood2]CAF3341529.1 unnamed protein product [Rotaria sp. Silwood2]CAF4050813.1 unnamed protein product [Rotaria sp. Silwood2]CAF4097526.1 unnamed protein product [Rotaria sp. Silwood2]